MKLSKVISLFLIALLLSAVTLNVYAASIHKWVDEHGVTHYSDQLPKNISETLSDNNAVEQIDVLSTYRNTGKNFDKQDNYYSVTNQWARMREERLARKQLQLEKAKQKAAQKPVVPQVVYINQAENDRPRNSYYPVYGLGHFGYQNRFHKRSRQHLGRQYGPTNRYHKPRFSGRYSRSGLTLSIR